MADEWYYARGEDKLGPFSARQLKDLADAGRILLTDTVWKAGIDRGVSAARVENLFPLAPAHSAPAYLSAPEAPTPSPSLAPTEAQGRAALGDPRPETHAEELPPAAVSAHQPAPGGDAVQRIAREQARKYAFDREDEPILRVQCGESF